MSLREEATNQFPQSEIRNPQSEIEPCFKPALI